MKMLNGILSQDNEMVKPILAACLSALWFPVFGGNSLVMEYDSPAATWNEALPIGNGRLGAMVYGAPGMERLQLNEDTLWAGGPNYALEPRMKEEIPKIRSRILAGDADGALREFKGKRFGTSKNGNSFAYQTIGSLCLKFPGHDFPTRYRRRLSLEDAVVRVEYDVGGVTFSRETFASLADDVIVLRLAASRPGAISFTAFFESPWQREAKSTDEDGTLTLVGRGSYMHGVGGCVRFCTRLKPMVNGGSARTDNGVLFVEGADEVVLWCSAATSFHDWQDGSSVDERAKADRLLSQAVRPERDPYQAALGRHVAAYAAQFNRCRVDLGPDPTPGRTVPERLASFKKTRDPHLAALYFAFGRYPLISSSQPSTQPPTLQGIWNEWLMPPWNSSYTVNINLEMNYWPEDMDDPEDRHRHVSHLYCAYPSAQVTPDTPDLFKAAQTSLDARGDVATGWGMGWRVALWTRFLDGERAYRVLEEQLSPTYATLAGTYRGGTYPNLLDAHHPFQIDGNLGCAAGIAELLVQSHRKTADGEIAIDILPALPSAWAAEGRATGLKARGGFELSFEWRDGRVTRLQVDSHAGMPAVLRYNGLERRVSASDPGLTIGEFD